MRWNIFQRISPVKFLIYRKHHFYSTCHLSISGYNLKSNNSQIFKNNWSLVQEIKFINFSWSCSSDGCIYKEKI